MKQSELSHMEIQVESPRQAMRLRDLDTAIRISEFLLGPDSWDDQHHTPGEIEYFQTDPQDSYALNERFYWYVEEQGKIVGIICAKQNEQRTNGYQMDYVAVHRAWRRNGIASILMETMIRELREQGGRYVLTHTCDLPEYLGIQRVFHKFGLVQVGYVPDYYFLDEGRISFMKRL